jgi:hypothetical protein
VSALQFDWLLHGVTRMATRYAKLLEPVRSFTGSCATTANAAPGCSLPDHVRGWVAERLLGGIATDQVVSALATFHPGVTDPAREVELIRRDPVLQAGLAAARTGRKLHSLMDALARQLRQSNIAGPIPIVESIDPRRFFDEFYFANRPVLLRGLMSTWKALSTWTPQFLADRFGGLEIEVQADRESDSRYDERFENHRTRMRLSEFVDRMPKAGNDIYLTAKNDLLKRPELAELHHDFSHPEGILDPTTGPVPRLWMGGASTVTPLHHDSSNILFGQVYGRKHVRLIPPFEIANVGNERSCFSSIDIDNPDLERFPAFRDVCVLEAVVEAGDFLLLPIGWWHAVRSLEPSISLSFQNFAVRGGPAVWHHASPATTTG